MKKIILLFFFLLSSSAFAALTDGLIVHLPFDGNANDLSSNANHGIVHGPTLVEDREGNPDSAYFFDGSDDYIYIPDNPSFEASGGLTISAWVKSDSNAGAKVIVSKWFASYDSYSYIFKDHNHTDTLRIELSNPTNGIFADLSGVSSIQPGSWIHVATTYDNNTLKIYFNGQEEASLNTSYLIHNSDYDLVIGGLGVPNVDVRELFVGVIDDVYIYNRGLSSSEIQQLFTSDNNDPPTNNQGVTNLHYIPQTIPPSNCNANTEGNTFYDFNTQTLMVCNSTVWESLQGEQGGKGDKGDKGEKGDTGLTGPQGPKGDDSPFADITCTADQVLLFNGSNWVCHNNSDFNLTLNKANAIPKWDGSQLVDSSSIVEDSAGNVGIGTDTPEKPMHLVTNTVAAAFRMETKMPLGNSTLQLKNTSQQFNVSLEGSDGSNSFKIYDITNGASIPLKIEKANSVGSTTNALVIDGEGYVGIGTESPKTKLHIQSSNGSAKILVEETSAELADRYLLEMINNSGRALLKMSDLSGNNGEWTLVAEDDAIQERKGFSITRNGTGVRELRVDPEGNTFIQGVLSTAALKSNSTMVIPTSATDNGEQGTMVWDSNYIYICTAPNTWKRLPLSTW